MKLKNQTSGELVKEYSSKFRDVYNMMEQVRRNHVFADMTKFTRALLRITTLVDIYKRIEEVNNVDRD